ncbi:MAG: aldo/keto reductase [Candidatus Dormibacteria bacterium]
MVGMGTNNFGSRMDWPAVERVVGAALEQGINLFDTAASYGDGESERLLGRALRGRREQAVIATKFAGSGSEGRTAGPGSAAEVRHSAEASLRRLGVQRIDLLQMHFPDPSTPITETLGALQELLDQGKVGWIGCSNFSAEQILEAEAGAHSLGVTPFICSQEHYSLLAREVEVEVVPALERLGMGLLPYFPLASGLLTGKYRRDRPPPAGSRATWPRWQHLLQDQSQFDRLERIERFAADRGRSMLEAAFAGLLRRPVVASVIAGATTEAQVRANAAAASWVLSAEEARELDRITAATGDAEEP